MSRFSEPQYRGAGRQDRERRRAEAEARQAAGRARDEQRRAANAAKYEPKLTADEKAELLHALAMIRIKGLLGPDVRGVPLTARTRGERLADEPVNPDSKYARACLLKRRYTSRAYAKAGARQQRKRGHEHMSAYECPYCGQWHLGHSTPARDTDAYSSPEGP